MSDTDALFARFAAERASRAKDPSRQKAAQLLERLLPAQRVVVEDTCRRKTILCAARAGKSYTFAVYILRVLLLVRGADVLFIAFIRSEAKEILWNLLKSLNEEFQIGLHFSEAELVVSNPANGGRARLAGCESWGDVDKFRGVPRHLVILDEAATWHAQLLDDLIRQVIEPRLGDYKGTLVMGGTPGAILAGPFYEATGPEASQVIEEHGERRAASRPFAEAADPKWQDVTWGWSLHGWPLSANTSERGKSAYEEALVLKKRNGWSDDNPIWVREYLGRWMADDSKLVFRYQASRNDWTRGPQTADNPFGLPEGHDWLFALCCDLGATDKFSLQLGAYSPTHPNLYQVYGIAKPHLDVTAIAEEIRKVVPGLVDETCVMAWACDSQGLGRTVINELATRHQIFLEKLEQREKRDHIELFNSGLVDRRIFVIAGSELSHEMTYLAWDATGLKTRPNQPNDNCDAFLGVVRHSGHLEYFARAEGPKPGTREFVEAEERKEEDRIAADARRRKRESADSNW